MELLKVELQDELFESLDERDIEVIKISNYVITFFVNRGKLISKGQLIAMLYKINKELMLRYGHQGDILSNIMCYDIISDDLVIPLLDKTEIYDDEYLSTISQKHDSKNTRKRGRHKDLLKLTNLTTIQFIDDILHDLNKNDKLHSLPQLISHNKITTRLDPRLIYSTHKYHSYPNYPILFREYLSEYYAEIGV